jgi:hypothetical protein
MHSRLLGFLAFSALALAAPAARAQGVDLQMVSNGAAGSLLGQDAAHQVAAFVTQRAAGDRPVLYFQISDVSPTTLGGLTLVLFGTGPIPAADLRSDGLGQLFVDTDTSANAAFTTYACPNPLPATPPFCTVTRNPGRVRFALARTPGSIVTRYNGQWTQQFGDTRLTQTGTVQSVSAAGSGFVGPVAFPAGATGFIEITQETVVVVQQGQ